MSCSTSELRLANKIYIGNMTAPGKSGPPRSIERHEISMEFNESRWNMHSTKHIISGSGRRRIFSRWIALLSIVSLFAGLIVPNVATATASVAYVTIAPANVYTAVGTSQTWTVSVTDSSNQPIQGVQIYAFVTGVNPLPISPLAFTDANGQTTFSYTSTYSGTDTITVFYDVNSNQTYESNIDISDTTTVAWAYPANLTLSPSTLTRSTSNGGLQVTATVTDTNSNPIEGVSVHYAISGTHSTSGTLTTGIDGTVTFTDLSKVAGTDSITASSSSLSDSATIQWILGGGTLLLSPSNSSPGVNTTATLTASLQQSNGDPIPGVPVYFSVSGQNYLKSSATTDANGEATFQYSSSQTGADTVRAYADFDRSGTQSGGEPANTAYVNWGQSSSASLTLSPSTQSLSTNTQASVTASLSNASASVSGVVIRYSVSGANTSSGTETTDASGNATVSYVGTNTGTDTVTAYADLNNNGTQDSGEPGATATVTWSGATTVLSLAPTTTTPGVGTTAYIATSLTAANVGVPNVPIRYTVSGANSTSGSMTTAGNGNTVISYNGTNAGTDTVTAYADMNNNGSQDTGEPTATVTITWGGTTTPPSTFEPAQPSSPKAGCTYFPATQHNLCAGFQAYWNQFGGLAIFGMPLTEEFQVNGVTTQYFERARFEWHPGTFPARYDVLLGLLGNEVTAGRGSETPFMTAQANSATGCTYYAATGHNLCGGFAAYWNQNGGLATFGYPISEEFQEKNPDTGVVYTVQYFQRARFEWHPGESPATFDVELGRLGAQVLQTQYGVSYY